MDRFSFRLFRPFRHDVWPNADALADSAAALGRTGAAIRASDPAMAAQVDAGVDAWLARNRADSERVLLSESHVTGECLTDKELEAFGQGVLAEDRVEHGVLCDYCASRMAMIPVDDAWVDAAINSTLRVAEALIAPPATLRTPLVSGEAAAAAVEVGSAEHTQKRRIPRRVRKHFALTSVSPRSKGFQPNKLRVKRKDTARPHINGYPAVNLYKSLEQPSARRTALAG